MTEDCAGHSPVSDIARAAIAYLRAGYSAEMSTRQMAVLAFICDEPGPHRASSLLRHLGVPKTAISRAVDALEGAGWARRRVCDKNPRLNYYEPTPQGLAFRAELAQLAA